MLLVQPRADLSAADVTALLQANPNVAAFEVDGDVFAAAVPNDPRFGEQVGLNNLAQTGGTSDADIDAPEAWDTTVTDTSSFVTAVIDYLHPDLYLNVWLNQGEIPVALRRGQPGGLRDTDADEQITFRDLNGSNGRVGGLNQALTTDRNGNGFIDAGDLVSDPIWANATDDDGNGFRNDLIGWDFANNDNDPFDDHGHGTSRAAFWKPVSPLVWPSAATANDPRSWKSSIQKCVMVTPCRPWF